MAEEQRLERHERRRLVDTEAEAEVVGLGVQFGDRIVVFHVKQDLRAGRRVRFRLCPTDDDAPLRLLAATGALDTLQGRDRVVDDLPVERCHGVELLLTSRPRHPRSDIRALASSRSRWRFL